MRVWQALDSCTPATWSELQDQTSKDLAAKKEQAESFVEDVIAKTKSCYLALHSSNNKRIDDCDVPQMFV